MLRPIEWVLLALILFVLTRGGLHALVSARAILQLRTLHLLIALSIVGCVELGVRVWTRRRSPLARGSSRGRRLWWAALPLALLPLVAAASAMLTASGPFLEPGFPAGALLIKRVTETALGVVGVGVPTMALWLWVGLWIEAGPSEASPSRAFAAVLRLARDWLPLLVLISGYAWIGATLEESPRLERDAWMRAADRTLFLGVDPVHALERIIWPPLSEWLAFAYSSYGVLYPLCLGAAHLSRRPGAFRQVAFALGLAMALAFTSYLLIPVKGPLLTETFDVPIRLVLTGEVKEAWMDQPRISWDCFPSMHTCATLLFAWAMRRYARPVFWAILPVVLSMPFACIYLRYHYVVDVLAGAGLAALCVAVARRLEPMREPRLDGGGVLP